MKPKLSIFDVLMIAILAVIFWPAPRTVEAQAGTVTLSTLADITGSGATVQLAASGTVRACQIVALAANGAVVRWGDSNTSISRGAAITAGSGQMLPALPNITGSQGQSMYRYALANIYIYIANGDKVSVSCVN